MTEHDDLRLTAIHEAGHHVAFRVLRPEDAENDCGEISMVPRPGTLGHHAPVPDMPHSRIVPATEQDKAWFAQLGLPQPDFAEEFDGRRVEDYIVGLYAGAAAERKHDPESLSAQRLLSDPTPEDMDEAEHAGPLGSGMISDREKAEAWLAFQTEDRADRAVGPNLSEAARWCVHSEGSMSRTAPVRSAP